MTGWLRRSALAIAALALVGMAMPKGAPGQVASMLFLVWTLVASLALARRSRTSAATTPAIARA